MRSINVCVYRESDAVSKCVCVCTGRVMRSINVLVYRESEAVSKCVCVQGELCGQ